MSFDGKNRRQFARVRAPVFFRSARFRSARQPVTDIGLGGLRVYSDEPLRLGDRLDVELLLPDATSVRCLVKVAWLLELAPDGPAKYDIGLQLLDVDSNDMSHLAAVLDFEP